ncbi:MAG: glycosyltransferase family 4 protein [Acidobacteriota bacterium]|nr:glycosyltransferase family 4 protein [Acidobacteriota bacterium]
MLKTEIKREQTQVGYKLTRRPIAVMWIDWYAYHITRFRALLENAELAGRVAGIEIVGGVGVHAGLKFREAAPDSFPVQTLFSESSWREAKGWKSAVAVWKCLNALNPSAVLVPGYYTMPGLAAALWGKAHGRRTVLMTESAEQDHRRTWWKEKFKSVLVRSLFDRAIAGGKAHRRYLERLGFRPDRIGRFYDVVDNEFFEDRSEALRKVFRAADFGLPDQYFLYVGRLAEEKNIKGLIAAYLQYRRSGGRWSLVLVGDGPLRKQLEEQAAGSRHGVDIRFEGLQGTADLPQYYAYAGCFVLPSSREPWGLVANEAMASRLPVIISRQCGCADDLVIEGENGLLFDPANSGDLTASLIAMGGLSAERLTEMGWRSRQIIARFSPERWAAEVARIVNAGGAYESTR